MKYLKKTIFTEVDADFSSCCEVFDSCHITHFYDQIMVNLKSDQKVSLGSIEKLVNFSNNALNIGKVVPR